MSMEENCVQRVPIRGEQCTQGIAIGGKLCTQGFAIRGKLCTQGIGIRPIKSPPLNQKFSATPKIYKKLCCSLKIVVFTAFFLNFFADQAKINQKSYKFIFLFIFAWPVRNFRKNAVKTTFF